MVTEEEEVVIEEEIEVVVVEDIIKTSHTKIKDHRLQISTRERHKARVPPTHQG